MVCPPTPALHSAQPAIFNACPVAFALAVAAWTCRGKGGALRGFVGVWPAMAMINHSCAPNASAMVLLSPREAQASEGGASGMLQARLGEGGEAGTAGSSASGSGSELVMVVRAARNIRADEEVTISYAGS